VSTAYDPIGTLEWMIGQAREDLAREQTVDAAGRRRRKSRAQADRERRRLEVLCEAVWNAEGRREPLGELVGRHVAAG
jgi:hypothetical protein